MPDATEMDDVFHCPECGWEWEGYNRPPPYPHCPECSDAILREGPAEEEIEPDSSELDELLEELRHDNERMFAFIEGYGAALSDRYDDEIDTTSMSKEEFRNHIRDRLMRWM